MPPVSLHIPYHIVICDMGRKLNVIYGSNYKDFRQITQDFPYTNLHMLTAVRGIYDAWMRAVPDASWFPPDTAEGPSDADWPGSGGPSSHGGTEAVAGTKAVAVAATKVVARALSNRTASTKCRRSGALEVRLSAIMPLLSQRWHLRTRARVVPPETRGRRKAARRHWQKTNTTRTTKARKTPSGRRGCRCGCRLGWRMCGRRVATDGESVTPSTADDTLVDVLMDGNYESHAVDGTLRASAYEHGLLNHLLCNTLSIHYSFIERVESHSDQLDSGTCNRIIVVLYSLARPQSVLSVYIFNEFNSEYCHILLNAASGNTLSSVLYPYVTWANNFMMFTQGPP